MCFLTFSPGPHWGDSDVWGDPTGKVRGCNTVLIHDWEFGTYIMSDFLCFVVG